MTKDKKKEKREYCRANHICFTCGNQNDSGYLECDECRKRTRQLKHNFIQRRIDNKLCIKCGVPIDNGKQKCDKCADAFNKYNRMVARSRMNNNQCSNCGKPITEGSNCDDCKAYFREKAQKSRAKKNDGYCSRCGKPWISDKYKTCDDCRQYHKDSYVSRKEAGVCPSCGKEPIYLNEKCCYKCLEKMRESLNNYKTNNPERVKEHSRIRGKELRNYRIANGLCVRCGKHNPTNKRSCPQCLAKCREKRHEKDMGFRLLRSDNKCYFCGKPTIKGMKVCSEHHKKMLYMSSFESTQDAREELKKRWAREYECI